MRGRLLMEDIRRQGAFCRLGILTVLFWLLLLSPLRGRAQEMPLRLTQYSHTAWRMQDGAFEGRPTAVQQTKDGYLWVGTTLGLLRFDGVRFTHRKAEPAPIDSFMPVTSLLAARDGSLYVGLAGALNQLKDNQLLRVPRNSSGANAPRGIVNSIVEDTRGAIWIALTRSKSGLCRFDGKAWRCFDQRDGFTCGYGQVMAEGESNSIWLGSGGHFCQWTPEKSTSFALSKAPFSDTTMQVMALATPPHAPLLVGSSTPGPHAGLQQLVNGQLRPFDIPGVRGSDLAVTALLIDRAGDLWIGTAKQGLYHVTKGVVDRIDNTGGLSGDDVTTIFEDREGSVWVGTTEGLDRLHRFKVSSFTTHEGIVSDEVKSVNRMPDGTMVFAGLHGLSLLKDGHFTTIDKAHGFPGGLATSSLVDHEGQLWVGIDDKLARFKDGKFTFFATPDGSPPGEVISLCEDSEHTIWVLAGGRPHRIYRVRGDHLEQRPTPDLIVGDIMTSDPVRGFWVFDFSGGHGYAHVEGEEAHVVPVAASDVNKSFRIPFQVEDGGSIWTWGQAGLSHYENGVWSSLDSQNGLPCDLIHDLYNDGHGTWWLNQGCGLVEIPDKELQRWRNAPSTRVVPSHIFGTKDGFRPEWPDFGPRAALGPNGRIWFANGAILQAIDPQHLGINTVPPPVHIEQLVADHKTIPMTGAIRLPALTRDVNIDYTALSFIAPERVRFRYRLSGVDKDWQSVNDRRQAFYMNLAPGHYSFQVIACNNDGVWNMQGDGLQFTILPAFYQTRWFLVLTIVLSLLLLWMIFRLRLRAATALVESRLGERVAERDRIARELHDTLLQGFQALLLRLGSVMTTIPEEQPARPMIAQMLDQGDEVLLEGRQRVRDLRSEENGEGDLAGRFGRLSTVFHEAGGPHLQLSVSGEPRPVQPAIVEEICLLAREAVSNAMRHSQGSEVDCVLAFTRSDLLLTVQDNGVGIDPQTLASHGKQGHWGLLGMRERAEKLNGTITIDSGPSGTRIALRVPGHVAFSDDRSGLRSLIRFFRLGGGD